MSQSFVGQIIIFAGNFAPHGFAFCNGQLLPISQNTALFSLLGTNYGGNGTTTFALPDLRSRAPVHFGQGVGLSFYSLGEVTGTETVVLTAAEIPAHSHFVNAVAGSGNTASPSAAVWAEGPSPGGRGGTAPNLYSTTAANATMAALALNPAGGGLGHPNIQPSIALNYCIALFGVFPARN